MLCSKGPSLPAERQIKSLSLRAPRASLQEGSAWIVEVDAVPMDLQVLSSRGGFNQPILLIATLMPRREVAAIEFIPHAPTVGDYIAILQKITKVMAAGKTTPPAPLAGVVVLRRNERTSDAALASTCRESRIALVYRGADGLLADKGPALTSVAAPLHCATHEVVSPTTMEAPM